MNLRDLQYLVALAEHRSFRRAAEACFVSQPTLSTQIRKLEEELGVELIERSPRKLLLTPAGQDAARRARTILAEVAAIRESARRLSAPEVGAVRLGVFPTLGPYLLPHLIPQMRARFPKLDLFLTEDKTDALLTRLREGKLDAAILALPVNEPQMQEEQLFDEPFLLAVPAGHPLARRRHLALADLAEQQLLLLEDGHCLRDQALAVCQLSGSRETAEFRATSLETLRQMVMAGNGITLMPKLAVQGLMAQPAQMRLIPFEAPCPSRRIGLVWRRSSPLGPLLLGLAGLCRDLVPGLLDPPRA
ncbi:DNA-binding transcriptional regulator OxyR [Acidisoma sp. C75]